MCMYIYLYIFIYLNSKRLFGDLSSICINIYIYLLIHIILDM